MATGDRPDPAPGFLMLGLSAEKQSLLLIPNSTHPLPNWKTWRRRKILHDLNLERRLREKDPSGTDTFSTSLPAAEVTS